MKKYTHSERKKYALVSGAVMTALLGACAGTQERPSPHPQPAPASAPLAMPAPATDPSPCAQPGLTPFECDRRSILAMAGEYRAGFAFDETAALAPGYSPHAAQRSGVPNSCS